MKYNELTSPSAIGVDMARQEALSERVRFGAPHYYALYQNLHGEIRAFIEARWDGQEQSAIRAKVGQSLIAYLEALYEKHNGKSIEEDLYGKEPFV